MNDDLIYRILERNNKLESLIHLTARDRETEIRQELNMLGCQKLTNPIPEDKMFDICLDLLKDCYGELTSGKPKTGRTVEDKRISDKLEANGPTRYELKPQERLTALNRDLVKSERSERSPCQTVPKDANSLVRSQDQRSEMHPWMPKVTFIDNRQTSVKSLGCYSHVGIAINVNCKQYKSNEIRVILQDSRNILVEGYYNDHGFVEREFSRSWCIAAGVNLENINCLLYQSGYLRIQSPSKGLMFSAPIEYLDKL